MKPITIILALAALVLVAACHTTKKSTAPVVATPAPTPAPAAPEKPARPKGAFAPRPEELAAIQKNYADVTMTTLNQGYALYTGVCTNCHGAKNIDRIPEKQWYGIINRMAPMAKISDAEKDAVMKYVLSVKATQPVGTEGKSEEPFYGPAMPGKN